MSLWACLSSSPRATWTWLPCGPFLDASGGRSVQMLQEGEAPVKGAIVTGTGRGIGRAAALAYGTFPPASAVEPTPDEAGHYR